VRQHPPPTQPACREILERITAGSFPLPQMSPVDGFGDGRFPCLARGPLVRGPVQERPPPFPLESWNNFEQEFVSGPPGLHVKKSQPFACPAPQPDLAPSSQPPPGPSAHFLPPPHHPSFFHSHSGPFVEDADCALFYQEVVELERENLSPHAAQAGGL